MSDQASPRRPLYSLLAKCGMTVSLIVFIQTLLFNPKYGLILPILPESWWPGAIRFSGIEILILLPAGLILSGIGLMGVASHGRKGILAPGITGVIASLIVGIPISAGFIQRKAQIQAAAQAAAPASVPTAPQVAATPREAAASKAAGIFVPALYRVDMVHDPKRDVLYITAGDSVLRYQLGSKTFLAPLTLGGDLRGIDISADNNLLAVADATESNGSVWIHLV